MPKTNPWATLASLWLGHPKSNPKIYPCDKPVIDTIKSNVNLKLDLWPEPFMGNPDADIYLLSGNPGCANYSLELQFAQDPTFSNAMAQDLQHQFPIQGGDFVYLNTNIQTHPGCTWWNQRTKTFREKSTKTFFNIDFFPYHSQNLKGIPVKNTQKYLPSYQYSNDLIQQAMNDEKIIIIMRLRNAWLQRIIGLDKYDKCYVLSSPQAIYLTPNNICLYSDYIKYKNNNNKTFLNNAKNKAWNSIVN